MADNQSIFTPDEQEALARQVYNLMTPWDRAEGSPKDIITQLHRDPFVVVEFLLDVINGNA